MTNLNSIIVMLCCLFTSTYLLAEQNITLLAFASEPIAYNENQTNKGIYVDILKEFGSRLGLKKDFSVDIVPFPRLLKMLENNDDGYIVSILFPNPKITPSVIQSVPVVHFTNGIISLRKNPLSLSNLNGSDIVTIRGTEFSYGDDFTQMIDDNIISIVSVTQAIQGIKMLLLGRVDGYFGPIILQKYWLQKSGYKWQNEIEEPLVFNEQIARLTISIASNIDPENANSMVKKMGIAMKSISDDRFIEKTIEVYIPNKSNTGSNR